MKAPGHFPLGKSEKFSVAVQRPSVDLRAAENMGEEAAAAARKSQPPAQTFSKHGTFSATPQEHLIESMWSD
jgi:hypothetical protein